MKEPWINDLRRKMASHQAPVPPALWESIEATLKKQKPAPVPFYRKPVMWASTLGGIAATILLALLLPHNPIAEPLQNPATASKLTARTPQQLPATPSAPGIQLLAQAVPASPVSKDRRPANDTPSTVSAKHSPEKPEPTPQKEETPRRTPKKDFPKNTARIFLETPQTNVIGQAATPRRKRLGLHSYTSNLPHTSSQTNGYSEFVSGTALPKNFSNNEVYLPNPAKALILSNLGKEVQTRKRHKLPVKFGLTARYHFSDRLSLESGLTYTRLSSELSSGTDANYFSTHQRLHYLGLPLSVNYDIWKNKRWGIYTSLGGALEKCIHGKSTTDYVLLNKKYATTHQHVMEKPLQCSVLGALGAQMNLTSLVALYAEPGLCYYFDNNSPVETIFKDQPLNFHFKLGVLLRIRD